MAENVEVNEEWDIKPGELTFKETIGNGTFSTVFKGVWRGTEVALKNLKVSSIETTQFVKEMDIISRLHHPNILQFLGACSPSIIVMEYMSNGTLEKANEHLSYSQKIAVIKDIARGLAYLHNRKPKCIIHRDLKPNNILLTTSNKAKIADFGISCLRPENDEMYNMTSETGTYRYMAPEVLTHQQYNTKVDVWSFGIIVYFMFCDQPYKNMDIEQIINHVVSILPMPNTHRIPEPLKPIFMKCTEYHAQNRISSLTLVTVCNLLSEKVYREKRSRWDFCICR